MQSNEASPEKINSGDFSAIFGETSKADYLISKRRKVKEHPKRTYNPTPEEIQKQGIGHPDFTQLDPRSAAAKLQRYIVLSYKNEKQLHQAKARLAKNPNVVHVSEVKKDSLKPSATSNDPLSLDLDQYQYGLYSMGFQSINQVSAWDKVKGHAYVGIVDEGLDIGHPDFLKSFRPHFTWDFDGNTINNAIDAIVTPTLDFQGIERMGHGQHVAGIIAADNDNGLGTSGICWYCSIMISKWSDENDAIAGYNFLAEKGAQVVNSSFEAIYDLCSETEAPWCEALQNLSDHDVVNVAAAGNGYTGGSAANSIACDTVQFPANDSRTIAVGATDLAGTPAPFSDHGSVYLLNLDFMAPGTRVLSTVVRNFDVNAAWDCGDSQGVEALAGYGTCTGTSMSAPHVTGLVALIRSADPLLNRHKVYDVLKDSSPNSTKTP